MRTAHQTAQWWLGVSFSPREWWLGVWWYWDDDRWPVFPGAPVGQSLHISFSFCPCLVFHFVWRCREVS